MSHAGTSQKRSSISTFLDNGPWCHCSSCGSGICGYGCVHSLSSVSMDMCDHHVCHGDMSPLSHRRLAGRQLQLCQKWSHFWSKPYQRRHCRLVCKPHTPLCACMISSLQVGRYLKPIGIRISRLKTWADISTHVLQQACEVCCYETRGLLPHVAGWRPEERDAS